MPSGPGSGSRWAFVNARRQKQRCEDEIARLQARIERLEGQVRDLGGDPLD